MNTLALECSTARGSVAARRGGAVVFNEEFAAGRGHGPALFAVLERALETVGKCERVVVGLGPGSYSGVRIAIAAAIGLEVGLGCELTGVYSIAGMEVEDSEFLVTGDARKQQFFLARVRDGSVAEGPRLLSFGELETEISKAGEMAIYSSAPIAGLAGVKIAYPAAARLAQLGEKKIGIVAEGRLEPVYLREPHITQPRASGPPR